MKIRKRKKTQEACGAEHGVRRIFLPWLRGDGTKELRPNRCESHGATRSDKCQPKRARQEPICAFEEKYRHGKLKP